MKSATLMVAIVTAGVMATTLGVAARHRGYHGNGGAVGNAQGGKVLANPGNAVNDKGTGDAPGTPAVDAPNGGKSAPSRPGDNPPVGHGNDAPLDLSITVYQGRARNLHTFKDSHEPKGGLSGKPYVLPAPVISTMPGSAHAPHYVRHQPMLPVGLDHGKAGDDRGALEGAPATNPSTVNGPGSGASGVNGDGKPFIANAPINPTNPAGVEERHTLHPATPEPAGMTTAPAISGTAMIHPRSVTGAIGGPVKIVSGVLNGTGFRAHHP